MADTSSRNPTSAPQLLADALLRSVGGTTALLRVSGASNENTLSEVGLAASGFGEVTLTPAVMRKLRPQWQRSSEAKWELLVSATSVESQVSTLQLDSAQALFGMTRVVTVAGQDYLIESVAANEAFGNVYMYRLLLCQARLLGM